MTKFTNNGAVVASLVALAGCLAYVRQQSPKVLTKAELASFGPGSETIYLAIFGQVFDVTSGKEFYARGQGYDFFAGCDGSKAFVTGDFETT